MRKLLYTINYGSYDPLYELGQKTPGWDYVCVTDNPNLKSQTWNIMFYDEPSMPKWLLARKVYILHNMFFGDYDLSIMCGGQYKVDCNLDSFLEGKISESADMSIAQHPARNCIYKELEACVFHKKITKEHAAKVGQRLLKSGIPREFGQVQCGVIIRKHDRVNLDEFTKLWFEETKFTTRDQISFMYVYWKTRLVSFDLFSDKELLKKFTHHLHCNGT